MDKTAIEHWAPQIGGQFWWGGLIFALIFVPLMFIIGKKLLWFKCLMSYPIIIL